MRTFSLVFCILLTFCQQAYAMLAISDQMLGSAQEYGRSRAAVAVSELQKPWTVDESLTENIYADVEKIIVYTPYLIVAMDSQNKAKAFEEIKLSDSKSLASGYEQTLVIGGIIDAPEKIAPENLQISLLQGEKESSPYYCELVAASSAEKIIEKTVAEDKKTFAAVKKTNTTVLANNKINIKTPVWNLQYYFYFDLSQINTALPLTVKIYDKLAGEREFRFHLANMY